jgi:hypothetical protein
MNYEVGTVDRLINIYCYLFINNNNIIVFI